MKTVLSRSAVGVLACVLAASCLGGQTGQPDTAACGSRTIGADHTWRGVEVQALGRALAGTHEAELLWQADPSDVTTAVLDDHISITVSYEGEPGRDDCAGGPLTIPVTVSLSSEASGISESGSGVLTFTSATRPFRAQLDYSSDRLGLSATLVEVAEQVAPRGELEAKEPRDLPTDSARIGGGS